MRQDGAVFTALAITWPFVHHFLEGWLRLIGFQGFFNVFHVWFCSFLAGSAAVQAELLNPLMRVAAADTKHTKSRRVHKLASQADQHFLRSEIEGPTLLTLLLQVGWISMHSVSQASGVREAFLCSIAKVLEGLLSTHNTARYGGKWILWDISKQGFSIEVSQAMPGYGTTWHNMAQLLSTLQYISIFLQNISIIFLNYLNWTSEPPRFLLPVAPQCCSIFQSRQHCIGSWGAIWCNLLNISQHRR